MQARFVALAVVGSLLHLTFALPARAQDSAAECFRQGYELSRSHKYREAIPYYTKTIERDGSNSGEYCNRGHAWNTLGEYDKALADFNEALRLDPKDAHACNNRGVTWLRKGEYDKAIADFNRAVAVDPKHAGAYTGRGKVWNEKGQYDKAIADLHQALRLNRQNADAYHLLAWIQSTCPDEKFRDGKEAVENASRARQLDGGKHWNPINTLAAAYAESGDFEQASQWQQKAVDLVESDRSVKEKDKEAVRGRLELYKAKKPYRDLPKGIEKSKPPSATAPASSSSKCKEAPLEDD